MHFLPDSSLPAKQALEPRLPAKPAP